MEQDRMVKLGGGALLLAGIGGLWWDSDGAYTHRTAVFVVIILAGFLLVVAGFLATVFSSHHAQADDRYTAGKEIGYDLGFFAGRASRQKLLMHPHHERLLYDVDHVDELQTHQYDPPHHRPTGWTSRRRGLVVAVSVALAGIAVAGVVAVQIAGAVPAELAQREQAGPPQAPGTPAPEATPWLKVEDAPPPEVADMAPPARSDAADSHPSTAHEITPVGRAAVPAAGARPGVPAPALRAPSIPTQAVVVAAAAPIHTPVPAPAPAVPLTAAEQTALDASNAAALTAANAKAAAELTAANAAAAAKATADDAALAAWNTAHPNG